MYLKSSLILLCCIFFSLVLYSQKQINISGNCLSFEDGSIISIKTVYPFRGALSRKEVQCTTVSKNHRFRLTVELDQPELYLLSVNNIKATDLIFLVPDKATITIKDADLKKIDVRDNKAENDYKDFVKYLLSVEWPNEYASLSQKSSDAFKNNNLLLADSLQKELDGIESNFKLARSLKAKDWIEMHSQSVINGYIIKQYLYGQLHEDECRKIFSTLSKKARSNSWGQELNYLFKSLSVGVRAPDFEQADTAGKIVRLHDFRGNFVLIDFWASWCVPCRKNNPYINEVYKKFRQKGFTIISVSLDNNKNEWIEAIKKDNLDWVHISDLQGWKNDLVRKFNITAIPNNFLLDRMGRIIAKNISPEDLENEIGKAVNIAGASRL